MNYYVVEILVLKVVRCFPQGFELNVYTCGKLDLKCKNRFGTMHKVWAERERFSM